MPDTPHPNALRLVLGFEMGLYTRGDVSAWVAAEVERRDLLPDPLLELTVRRPKNDVDIANLLRALAPPTTPEVRARTEIAILGELVRDDRVLIDRAVCWAITDR